jgi:protein-L-isoaspartate(D-aspartate) O-methyltransferase
MAAAIHRTGRDMQDAAFDLFAEQRQHMLEGQIRTYDVTDLPLLEVIAGLPRERFVPQHLRAVAYADCALDLGGGRWVLPPMLVARMIQAAAILPGQAVLDVAAGAGYTSAILAGLGARVTALESDAPAAARIGDNLRRAGVAGVDVVSGPLADGAPSAAPFDVILVDGGFERHPDGLLAQLRDGGRLIGPAYLTDEGDRAMQVRLYVKSSGTTSSRALFNAAAPVLADFRQVPQFRF